MRSTAQASLRATLRSGDYYRYEYDAVGNRVTQVKSFGGQQCTDTYQYDIASRLLSVNEAPYTWDDNGNRLNDGVNSYTHDAASRLMAAEAS